MHLQPVQEQVLPPRIAESQLWAEVPKTAFDAVVENREAQQFLDRLEQVREGLREVLHWNIAAISLREVP